MHEGVLLICREPLCGKLNWNILCRTWAMKILLAIQVAYYVITAVWPMVHMRSFMSVSGYKADAWLVNTVSLLLLSICTSFVLAIRTEVSEQVVVLSIATACAMIIIDVYYNMRGVIARTYLLDALIQGVFVVAWVLLLI